MDVNKKLENQTRMIRSANKENRLTMSSLYYIYSSIVYIHCSIIVKVLTDVYIYEIQT